MLEGLLSLACHWGSYAAEKHCRPVASLLEGLGHAGSHLLGPVCQAPARHFGYFISLHFHNSPMEDA